MRSSWSGVGPCSNVTGVLIKRGHLDPDPQGPPCKREGRVVYLLAKESQGCEQATRIWGAGITRSLPSKPGKEAHLLTPWSWPSGLQTIKQQTSVVFVCVAVFGSPNKAGHPPRPGLGLLSLWWILLVLRLTIRVHSTVHPATAPRGCVHGESPSEDCTFFSSQQKISFWIFSTYSFSVSKHAWMY